MKAIRNRPDISSKTEHLRLRVESDPDWDTIVIADENATSWSDKAEPLSGTTLEMDTKDVEWLHGVLGEYLADRRAVELAERKATTRRPGEAIDERKKVAE